MEEKSKGARGAFMPSHHTSVQPTINVIPDLPRCHVERPCLASAAVGHIRVQGRVATLLPRAEAVAAGRPEHNRVCPWRHIAEVVQPTVGGGGGGHDCTALVQLHCHPRQPWLPCILHPIAIAVLPHQVTHTSICKAANRMK